MYQSTWVREMIPYKGRTTDNLNESSMSIANMETILIQSSRHTRACPLSSNCDDLQHQIEELIKDAYPRLEIISDTATEIINLKSCHSSDYYNEVN